MVVSAAVCPHPPALVPEVSQEAAGQLAEARDASRAAVRRLRDAEPELLVCVGAGAETRRWGREAGGNLWAYGVDVSFGGPEPALPLSLTVAAYLLEVAGSAECDIYQAVSGAASPDACRAVGVELAGLADRVALLVMGDGSAKRTQQSPGAYDEGAEAFDAEAVRALAAPDPDALLTIDPGLADALWVAGRPAWQVLAGALLASPARWSGRTTYDAAPLGVGYVVVELEAEDRQEVGGGVSG